MFFIAKVWLYSCSNKHLPDKSAQEDRANERESRQDNCGSATVLANSRWRNRARLRIISTIKLLRNPLLEPTHLQQYSGTVRSSADPTKRSQTNQFSVAVISGSVVKLGIWK